MNEALTLGELAARHEWVTLFALIVLAPLGWYKSLELLGMLYDQFTARK